MNIEEKRSLAWIGDAVLALYARKWILKQNDISIKERAEAFQSMTSNEFLSYHGEPTQVECTIGQVYEKDGLNSAFNFIETTLMPIFLKRKSNVNCPVALTPKKTRPSRSTIESIPECERAQLLTIASIWGYLIHCDR